MNSYEDDLRRALKVEFESGNLRESGACGAVFSSLSKAFPAKGSKIDWAKVPGSVERTEHDEALQPLRFVDFFNEMRLRFSLSGTVVYVGDSATPFALEGSAAAMRRALPLLLEVPQHHYLIGSQCSWCICLTMEGDMGFGFGQKGSQS